MVDLIIDGGSQTLDGIHTYDNVNIINGGILHVTPYNGSGTTGELIIYANAITIDSTSVINANYVGYAPFSGEGWGRVGSNTVGSGGGGYGGAGGSGGGSGGGMGGAIYGTVSGTDIDRGSGGGTEYAYGNPVSSGGTGGGLVSLNSAVIKIYGQIIANGSAGGGSPGQNVGAAGGGSGGGILINGGVVDITNAVFRANGGPGGTASFYGYGGGGGGGGRIKIFSNYLKNTGLTTSANAGSGGSGGLGGGGSGGVGSIELAQNLSQSATVIINATPIGSKIIINGIDTGLTTYNTINLIPGTYQLTLSYPCYESSIDTINVVLGDTLTINRTLVKNTGNELTINSTPVGANVYIDGIIQPETTPITPRTCVPEGTHLYTIYKAGYQTYRGIYSIVRSTSTAIDATLLPLGTPGTGSIDIRSNPTGAEIFLDNIDKGIITPSVLSDIPNGSHTIRLTKTGFLPVETTIIVDIDTTDFVFLTFLYPAGSLSFESTPSGAEIFLAPTGQTPIDQGVTTPATILDLQIGLYDYILRLGGYNDITGTIDITQGITTPISTSFTPSQGCILFSTDTPGASIYIDDTLQEGVTTPALICGLTLGPHTYRLELTGYRTVTGNITLISDQGETISVPLVSCTPNWVCRQPLDGYERDENSCGQPDRLNEICNAPVVEAGMGGAGMILVAGLALGLIVISGNKGSKTKKLEQTFAKNVSSTGR